MRARAAGIFLFLPLSARLRFDPIVRRAGDPGSKMVPATGALDNHSLPRRGKAGPRLLSFFAQGSESRVLCYANANPTRADQPGERMRSVAFWRGLTGHDPEWPHSDSEVVPSPEPSRVNRRGIHFVTIRRRGAAVIRRLRRLPPQAWQRAVIDTPKRCHQHIRFIDEMIRLPGYDGAIRPSAVDGPGRERPTSFVSNDLAETARSLIIRDAGRNAVADGLGTGVSCFHLDCLSSEVRLDVDRDAVRTVLADGCDRWLARRLHGFDRPAPKEGYRKFVETGGRVEVQPDRSLMRSDKRSHDPILREAEWDKGCPPIPWLGGRPVSFIYP